jgi:hypothetical protein
VAFFFIHIMMVLLAGPINEVRSMITGKYKLPGNAEPDPEPEVPQGEPA